jgi:hypothetical protein
MLSKKTNLILCILVLGLSNNIACMEVTFTPNVLVTHPLDCLKKIRSTCYQFKKDLAPITFDLPTLKEEYISITQKHEKPCPLFLLNECTHIELESSNTPFAKIPNCYVVGMKECLNCPLSRDLKPKIREAFEKHASQLLIKKLQECPDNITTYTSFGCGDAFQDLIIVTKALIMQPKARLNIHLIDGNNTPYVSAADYLEHSREIKTDETYLNFGRRLTEYEQHARNKEKDDQEIQAMPAEALQQQLALLCIEKETQYKQFIKWLTQAFPQAQISLYIHDIVSNYCVFLMNNNIPHADVFTAADICHSIDINHSNSCNQYVALCLATLIANPTSNDAWLIDTHHGAGISTARSPESPEKIYFDCEKI